MYQYNNVKDANKTITTSKIAVVAPFNYISIMNKEQNDSSSSEDGDDTPGGESRGKMMQRHKREAKV